MAAISSAREGVREKFTEEMSLEPGHSCKITPDLFSVENRWLSINLNPSI